MTTNIKAIAQHRHHGGVLGFYQHASDTNKCEMRFSVFVPPQAMNGTKVPSVYWLAGLTCTLDNFTTKGGDYGVAAELPLIIVAPDTSPRGPVRQRRAG
jgi:S-formylglutathione hydrolase